jgi:hypothetical protein
METAVETLPGPSSVGSVVLDIGGEVGAAAIYVPASLAGVEIEIRRVEDPWRGTHVAVLERILADRSVFAALFSALREGSYQIRVKDGDPSGPIGSVDVVGGRVTVQHWLDD